MKTLTHDALVVGAGIAGATAALELAAAGRSVALVTKTRLGQGGSSRMAQGGIAVAIGAGDSPRLHAEDTLNAAAGTAHGRRVEILTREGVGAIFRLMERGAEFDRDEDGVLELGREAAHGRRRILHAQGDATGAEAVRALRQAVRQSPHIEVIEQVFVNDLWLHRGRVHGATGWHVETGESLSLMAPAVILATGGVGQVYAYTTNPVEVTGDGIAMAARAGAAMADMEFVQFHPTALNIKADPLPLLTEAIRGEGAWLVDGSGHRFMVDVHPDAELAPRDVVARALFERRSRGESIYLDPKPALAGRFAKRFPGVDEILQSRGLDPEQDLLPVTPAAHYFMGGIAVDDRGASTVPGLWACGEASSTGVHGANRLASNSLLEGLVFGMRTADAVANYLQNSTFRLAPLPSSLEVPQSEDPILRNTIRETMWRHAGVVRTGKGLVQLQKTLTALGPTCHRQGGEIRNLWTVADLITSMALGRRESRGAHFRTDFPFTDDAWAFRRTMTWREVAHRRMEGGS